MHIYLFDKVHIFPGYNQRIRVISILVLIILTKIPYSRFQTRIVPSKLQLIS